MTEKKYDFSYDIENMLVDASWIYEQIKDIPLKLVDDKPYNHLDKKCLSLFLGILKTDNMASKFLKDFDITYQSVQDALALKLEKKAPEHFKANEEMAELVLLLADGKSRYYTRDVSVLELSDKLLISLECGSDFFADINIKMNDGIYDSLKCLEIGLMINRRLELEEEHYFTELNKKVKKDKPVITSSSKKNKLENKGVLEELGANPYNIDLSYGRDDEIRRLMISLLMPSKSALIIGEAGVGKTALVEGLAHRIIKEDVPEVFLDKKIYSLNVAALVSGCKYVGMFEEKLMKTLDEIAGNKNIILFIDEVHAIVGAGKGANSSNDMANILKPYLDSGKIKVIGTTTIEEYEKYIKPNTGLKRRFEVIKLKEPNNETLKNICCNVIDKLCLEMNMFFLNDVYLKDEVIECLIKLTDNKHRHYQDKVHNPDLIVSIIMRSFAIAKFYGKEIVEINDLVEATQDNERIYDSAKTRIVNNLMALDGDKKEIPCCKIIKFSDMH